MRWLVTAAGLVIATILIAVGVLLWNLRDDQIAKSEKDLESLVLVLSEQIDRTFQSIELLQRDIIERVASLDIATPAEFRARLSDEDMHHRLQARIRALPHVDALILTDPDGKLVNFSRYWPLPEINFPGEQLRFKTEPALTSFAARPLRSPADGQWSLPFARRINSRDGQLLGSILGVIKLKYFDDYFASVAGSHDHSVALFDGEANLVTRYPADEKLRGRALADRSLFRLLATARHGTVRQAGLTDRGDLIISGRRLAHYPFSVVITRKLNDVLASWQYAALYVGAAAAAIVLLIAGLTIALARRIARDTQEQKRRLDVAINNMPQALAMFDRQGRLIICNERYGEMYGLPTSALGRGTALVDILRTRLAYGIYKPGPFDDPEKFSAFVLDTMARGEEIALVQGLQDGRYISVHNRPMADGSWVTTHEDITQSRLREESFRLLFDNNPVPMWVFDRADLRFLAVNNAAVEHYGYTRGQFMSMTALDIRPADDRERFKRSAADLLEAESGGVWRHQKADGSPIDVSIYARALEYAGREAWLVAAHDITDRQRAEEQLRRTQKFLDMVVENVPVPIMVKEVADGARDAADCRYTLVNRACEELFGVTRDQLIGKSVSELYPKERADFIIAGNNQTLLSEEPVVVPDHMVATPCNGLRYAVGKSFAVRDDDRRPRYLLTVLEDVTERREWERRIARMAHYDSLTDLPNRVTFNDALDAAIAKAERTGGKVAVMSLDLDGFKDVNDTYGHGVGDALLREAARRLQEAADAAFVARLGGDEFALIVSGAALPDAADAVGKRVLKALSADFVFEDRKIAIGASIGAALYPDDGADSTTLMLNADLALYCAKAEFRGALLLFDGEMGERMRDRRVLQQELSGAIEANELALHYQPQQTMAGETVGFEVLLRWCSPKRGMVPPSTFIPIAEESGLIAQLGEWVLRAACREAAAWPGKLTLAVNISPIQFRDRDLAATVHSILLETGLPPERLELEITEGVLIDDFSRALAMLRRLKTLGVKIALDDFGTGYSSLSYLHAFPFDKIKIDRTFVGDLETNQHSRAVVRAVIDLGQSLDVPVLAEGVETAAQHLILLRNGCDEVQGYLTGRPLPIESYRSVIERAQDRGRLGAADAVLSPRPPKRASPSRQARR
jgi:diguanylate cyclase (GGDEF)-like protein/PAS domain S-box-containing protein